MKKKNPNKKPIWLLIAFFAFSMLLTLLYFKSLDNDIWYILSEGRYIVQNGIYHIDPLSIHEGLEITVQNWLSASLFWVIFDTFGEMGLLTLVLLCNLGICFLLYKICMLLSDDNYFLSLIIMFICDITLASHYIVSRPQVISFCVLLGLILALEKYIKTENWKYLIWLPVLSLIEINMHASLWWMLFLFTLPYVIDSFKIPFAKTQGYKKKPLFIAILIAFLVGFINPYGYKAITFIFTSYGDKFMHKYINELLPFSFSNNLSKHMFILMLTVGLIYTFFREGKVRVRYICLFCGTLILGFMSVKGFSHFILVSLFPLAYFFKDLFPKDLFNVDKKVLTIFSTILMLFSFFSLGAFTYLYVSAPSKIALHHDADEAMDALAKNFTKNDAIVYSSFNNGGYVEFRGFKAYIDPRAEVYLKKNNKKADIFEENYKLQHGDLSISEFLNKYNFTHLLVQSTDYLYNRLSDSNYFIYYENTKTGYRLFVRNDMVDADERERIIDSYSKAITNAKENATKENK